MNLKNSTLDDIAAVIGFTATLRLAAWFGEGGNVYVPFQVEEGQVLVNLLGMSAARRLTEAWPGEHIAVPRPTQYEVDLMKRQVATLLESGFSSRKVSHWMRVSERRIQQICRELELAGLMQPVAPGGNWHGNPPSKKRVGRPGRQAR